MIENIFNTTCQILKRESSSKDSWGNWQYNPGNEVNCLFIDRTGVKIRDSKGDEVIISGKFILTDVIDEVDKILFEEYEYEIVPGGIEKKQDILTGEIEGYGVNVIRRRKYGEKSVTVR